MRKGVPARIGIGNRDPAAWRAGNLQDRLILRRIEKRVKKAGIAMRPTVDRDRENVARGVKIKGAEHGSQLLGDLGLKVLERHVQQGGTPGAGLVILRQAGGGRDMDHAHDSRLGRALGILRAAQRNREIQHHRREEGGRTINRRHPGARHRLPVAQGDLGIDQRRLDIAREGIFLDLRQFGGAMGDDHIVAGQNPPHRPPLCAKRRPGNRQPRPLPRYWQQVAR